MEILRTFLAVFRCFAYQLGLNKANSATEFHLLLTGCISLTNSWLTV